MSVSAIIVTRGDVDLMPVLDSLPHEWESVVWDNGRGVCGIGNHEREEPRWYSVPDLKVYGRYKAIEHASHELVYVQDDDVIVSDPQAIVDEWTRVEVKGNSGLGTRESPWEAREDHVVCNMPPEYRHGFYLGHALVGFGAVFHRDTPEVAFSRFRSAEFSVDEILRLEGDWFQRTCDVVFTGLGSCVLVDVPVENLPYANDASRMYLQPGHVAERQRMLNVVRSMRT